MKRLYLIQSGYDVDIDCYMDFDIDNIIVYEISNYHTYIKYDYQRV